MDINSLPDDPATLKALIVDMAAEHQALEQRLRLLNLIIYGPKSEKKPRTGQEQQLSLFDEAEQTVEEHKPQTFEEACAPASTRRKRGRRPIPADLPRVEIIHVSANSAPSTEFPLYLAFLPQARRGEDGGEQQEASNANGEAGLLAGTGGRVA